MDALLEGLNEAQKSAVTSPANVVQVLAPPGSGKTKTLTARVAYHINHERLQPWNIIVCTFTIKAAREMKARIQGFVGEKLESKLILGTFHSVARRFLSRYGHEIGIDKNFGIADTDDSKAIIKRIVNRYQYTVDPGHARSRISSLKAKGVSDTAFATKTKRVDGNEFAQVYSSYQEHLSASNLLDYDDLLVRCVDLLQRHPQCVSTIQAVLIDEYQDTNNIQYQLMKLLARSCGRITIVGDPDQSIYSFRSAEIENLYKMRKDYPEALVINLEKNYRSSGCILKAALAVIRQDEARPDKALLATHCVGEQPTLRHLATGNVEAQWLVGEIQRSKTLSAGLFDYNDYAILLRSASLSLSIERELGRAGIPYRMVGGRRFFDRAEIKIVLNYLRCISNPNNNDAIVHVINTPSRKIGDKTIKSLIEETEVQKRSLWNLVTDIAQGRKAPSTRLSVPTAQGITLFFRLIHNATKKLVAVADEPCNLVDLISYILTQISFQAYLKQNYKENHEERWENVNELIIQATELSNLGDGDEDALPNVDGMEQRTSTASDMLSKFLVNVALATEPEKTENGELKQVTISTIHAAKGLEWPVVFVPAVYNGSLPHSRAENHDEERRLLYVGMTRAQALLYLSCPMKLPGQDETTLSSFITPKEIQGLFSCRGPDLAFKKTTVPDLANILGRPCPSLEELQAACGLLDHLEDDQYPGTREEIDGDDFSRRDHTLYSSTDRISAYTGHSATNKRRRLDRPQSTDAQNTSISTGGASAYSITSTTMHTASTGFTSARQLGDLRAFQEEAERIRIIASTPSSSSVRAAPTTMKEKPKLQKQRSAKPGQDTITSFFKSTRSESAIEPDFIEKTGPAQTPYSHFTNVSMQNVPYNMGNIRSSSLQQGHPNISHNRPVRNDPMASKPKRQEVDDPIKYVLLSSSPMKPEPNLSSLSTVKNVENSSEFTMQLPTEQSSTFASFRAASTFHTTSMDRVQTQTTQRRTLGTRRTMQGWSVKNKEMPKPRQT